MSPPPPPARPRPPAPIASRPRAVPCPARARRRAARPALLRGLAVLCVSGVVAVAPRVARAADSAADPAPAAPHPAADPAAAADPYQRYVKTSRDFERVAQDPKTLLKAWPNFVYMPWTARWTIGYDQASGQWSLDHGYNGAFVDRQPAADKLQWINQFKLPFYVDHTADKGSLHLWDGGAVKPHLSQLHGTGLRPVPINDALKLKLQSVIKKNITASISSPCRAAYALDDEISWGHFVHPTMWQITDDNSAYPRWLKEIYGDNAPKRDKWISYGDILPHLSTWSIADFDASPLMDQWTFNDAIWCNFLGDLVAYANSVDPATPVGIVGGQEPSAFGGYDYARLMRKIQFIEAYNLGSSQAVIRSFNPHNALPAVTTHFHKNVDDSVWQAWYYLAHGNRGFIGWVQNWFDDKTPKPFHDQIAPTLKEVERLSPLLSGATWQHDGIALYYSHPSIQLGWILDAQAHRNKWTARNGDHRLGSAPNVRHAWENMLRDEGLQYNFLSYVDVVQTGIPAEYTVIILPATLCLSDVEASRLRDFVQRGGTLIADYLPGCWDQHGVGRKSGGVLDDVFGIKHDPTLKAADLFGGTDKLWVELDQEASFNWKTYESFLTKNNTCIKDASGFDKAVRNMPVVTVNPFGKGKAVLMNLSPQWYNAYRAAGEQAARKREVFLKHLGIKPTVQVTGPEVFGHEITRWQNNGRTILFVTLNPEIAGSETGGGNAAGLKSATRHVQLTFDSPLRHPRNQRTGQDLPDAILTLPLDWKQNEAIMISYDSPTRWASFMNDLLRCLLLSSALVAAALFSCPSPFAFGQTLEQGWNDLPRDARLRAYWWWLNGNVTKASITHDLEQMKAKGFGGALICDAGGAEQDGNDPVPHGPTFFSAQWRDLYKHALREADRLGLEMSLNIQSGWNLGGPMVKAEDAAKKLIFSQTRVTGPAKFAKALPEPKHKDPFYRDLFVVAYPMTPVPAGAAPRRPIANWSEKAMYSTLHFSAPDTSPLLTDLPAQPGEADARRADVVDLTASLKAEGTLAWDVPAGEWEICRFGFTVGDHARVSTASDGWGGYAADVLDRDAFARYWNAVVEPLIADAGPLAGTTLKYLHTDSWEVEAVNWTPTLREEFKQRRGYEFLPFLPTLAGRIIDDRATSNRFLHDFRRTLGDLAVAHHYVPFRDWAHRHGLLTHPESGGPHASPIDAQQCLGQDDAPMSEFWAESWRHRTGDANRFFVKQPAAAAHTYGHRLVLAEGFTTIGPHWQETIWDNLKPSFDKAICEGMNRLVWHAFVNSPKEMGLPGIQYFAGTHFNPNVTWWEKSAPFLAYINRTQYLMQRGLFVADACYYYGDHVPNFAQLRASDPAKLGFGYDYDVVTADAIVTRATVRDGRITLPDGMSYRVLVLPPDRPAISIDVLRKLKTLVEAGATIIGPKPTTATGLSGFPESDQEVRTIADALWGETPGIAGEPRAVGKGRVVQGITARQFFEAEHVPPDFQFHAAAPDASIDYIHRRDADADADADIYFIANRAKRAEPITATFRIAGKAPELWDAVSGQRRFAAAYTQAGGLTTMPMELAPCGSIFVLFQHPAAAHPAIAQSNTPTLVPRHEIDGPWTVTFDPKLGGPPAAVTFDKLVSWTTRPEPAIRFYAGAATYHKTFDIPPGLSGANMPRLLIDLGNLRELAEVKLNGQSLGVCWAPPFRIDVTDALTPTANQLDVEVVNFWPNRIIGDASLPQDQRITRTNIRKLTATTPLTESGLLGPVRILEAQR